MKAQGRRFAIPVHRRMILDVCRSSLRVPSYPVDRLMHLRPLMLARELSNKNREKRIGWVTLFLKGYAVICREIPELRTVFYRLPWPGLYEHPQTVGSISIHRSDDHGGERLIWAHILDAEAMSLLDIQQRLDDAAKKPLSEVFAVGLRMERQPAIVRRFTWWLAMNCAPRRRAKRIGTFSISTLAGEDASNYGHPLVVTSSLSYTRCNAEGDTMVTMIADHRVLDGMLVARALRRLEDILNTQIVDELKSQAVEG